MKTTIIGFPRIGVKREIKFYVERYFNKETTENELKDFIERHNFSLIILLIIYTIIFSLNLIKTKEKNFLI